MDNFFEFLRTSFLHVAPILAVGAFAIAIIVERSKALLSTYPLKDSAGFFEKIGDLVMTGRVAEAVALCDRYHVKPAAKVAKQALLRAHQPESMIEQGLALAVAESTEQIQRRTSFLATIANVATLLGLLGTIAGLIHSFEAVGHADPQQKSALLAAGISQAMNATMLGLGVAIPCMIAYSFLMNRTNRLLAEVDQAAVRTLDVLKQSYYAAETEALSPRARQRAVEDDELDDEAQGAANGKSKVVSLRRQA